MPKTDDSYMDTLNNMKGHQVRVFGEYLGWSNVFCCPAINVFGLETQTFRIDDLEDADLSFRAWDYVNIAWKEPIYAKRTIGNVTYLEPVNWKSQKNNDKDNVVYYYPYEDDQLAMVMVMTSKPITGTPKYEEYINAMLSAIEDSVEISSEEVTIDGYDAYFTRYNGTMADHRMDAAVYVLNTESYLYAFMFGEEDALSDNMLDFMDIFIENIKIGTVDPETEEDDEETEKDNASPTPEEIEKDEPTSTPTPTPTPKEEMENHSATTGERNALSSAKTYLRYSAFSHDGLINQLKYEGYSDAEAKYGADNCGADWKEQALKSAKTYLEYSAFSYSGLIKQLEYEKYTSDQAKYGADNCGADWKEQAVKSAATYLKYSSFSRDGLIKQLEYEGFTHEQAVYGAEKNGY